MGLQKFLVMSEFGGESRGNKTGFYCILKTKIYPPQKSFFIYITLQPQIPIVTFRIRYGFFKKHIYQGLIVVKLKI
jgi:hypothetical protein